MGLLFSMITEGKSSSRTLGVPPTWETGYEVYDYCWNSTCRSWRLRYS